jgi:hypothetical protein
MDMVRTGDDRAIVRDRRKNLGLDSARRATGLDQCGVERLAVLQFDDVARGLCRVDQVDGLLLDAVSRWRRVGQSPHRTLAEIGEDLQGTRLGRAFFAEMLPDHAEAEAVGQGIVDQPGEAGEALIFVRGDAPLER